MDSGNSASLQSLSSSGGDDEFDSRCGGADSSPLSALLRHPPPQPSAPVPGFGDGSLIYGLQELRTPPPLSQSHWCSTTTTAPLPPGADASASPPPSLPAMAADQADAAAPAPAPPRGSRKRARASRRAPTTVLTTDTSNFRAMVQEFTGIPAPPFAGGGAAATTARSRFDHLLFPLRTGTAAAAAGTAALPQYLLRPFAHKLHPYPPSFTSPSTTSPAPAIVSIAPASTTTHGTSTTALSSSSSFSYHHQQLTAASTSALLGTQKDHTSSNNYHSFHQSSSLGGHGKYAAAHPAFVRGIAPPPPPPSATGLQDPPDFLGLTHEHDAMVVGSQGRHAHLHSRNDGGDELSGMVGGASVAGAGGCKATYSSTRPLLERSRRNLNPSAGGSTATATATTTALVAATAAGMRTQAGVVDSWVCTSD